MPVEPSDWSALRPSVSRNRNPCLSRSRYLSRKRLWNRLYRSQRPHRPRPNRRQSLPFPLWPLKQSTDEPVDESSDEPFSQHVLASVRELHGELEIPKEPDILQPHSVPALPAQPGWLNDHVGMVEAGWERWQNADGTRESRIVMANGQVVCGRARAPVPSEIFNPQFALNIMAFRLCGRERPEPVDRTDPWLRGGPK